MNRPRRTRIRQQPTALVRDHITWLLSHGVTRNAIVASSGVSEKTIRNILTGATNHVRAGAAAALLAVRPASADRGYVPSLGTVRRLQALVAFGYPARHLADRTGLAHTEICRLLRRGQAQVTGDTRRRVADLFERLSVIPGPSDEARRIGSDNKWPVPAAWDDIDDPVEEPRRMPPTDPRVLVNRVLTGKASIDLLRPRQQVNLWRAWERQARKDGKPVSARQFAIRFGVGVRCARQIAAAAGYAGLRSLPGKPHASTGSRSHSSGFSAVTERTSA